MEQVEISSFDLRFEGYRLRNKSAERILLVSILEKGIQEPLQGVDFEHGRILLNGFKRYRCARELNIHMVPYQSLAEDMEAGIIELLRLSNAKSLSILEQAKMIDELKCVHKMGTGDIAQLLDKSKAWVSVRTGIVKEMSPKTMDRIMNGEFPVYAYMYILRPFIRIKIKNEEIDEFVDSVAGKGLSIRDIERLARGYFKGSEEFRKQVRDGDIAWALNTLKAPVPESDCSQVECRMLKSLEITQKYMLRVISESRDDRFKSNAFYAQANLLSGGILRQIDAFHKAIGELNDRTRKT